MARRLLQAEILTCFYESAGERSKLYLIRFGKGFVSIRWDVVVPHRFRKLGSGKIESVSADAIIKMPFPGFQSCFQYFPAERIINDECCNTALSACGV
jgi:hypothetical protein